LDTSAIEYEITLKPWKNNPDKNNPCLRIYLKGQKEKGYFELIKDQEGQNYSVHFKTKTEKGLG